MKHALSIRFSKFLFVVLLIIVALNAQSQKLFDPEHLNHPSKYGATVADKLETEEVYEYKFPKGDRVILKNGFRQSGFVNAEEWLKIKDSVDVLGVDIVYSKYPIRNGTYHEIYPLLFNRIKATIAMDPALNNSSVRWRKIWQTHCENNAQVNQLYHGVVIWYTVRKRPDKTPPITIKEPSKEVKNKLPQTGESGGNTPKNADSYTVEFILNHPETPDSLKKLVEGKTPFERAQIVRTYFLEEKRKQTGDESLNNPIMRMNYMYAVEGFMSQFPKVESVVDEVLNRHPEWDRKLVVNDWTGSMYGYGSQVLLWHLMHLDSSGITTITLFNDGNNKTTEKKAIGRTGGIYTEKADNAEALIDLFTEVMKKGGGGDGPENDIEAILKVAESDPDAEIVLIADNGACVRDIELADQIGRPVRIILCGYSKEDGVNPDYVYLAHITGGGIYTIEEDIESLSVQLGEDGTITSYDDDRLKLSAPQCFDAVFGRADGRIYSLKKARFNKKKVHVLNAANEGLEDIPGYVYKMNKLQSIDLHGNRLVSIDEDILQLKRLSVLNISKNDITTITDKIDKLGFLEYFYAHQNKLSKLPEGLYELDFLKEVDVSNNQLSEVGKFDSKQLERVQLSHNNLTELPSFNRNRNLIELHASHNQLTEFPEKISLKQLEHLDLSFNQISKLPEDLSVYKELKSLNLKGNPISEEERIRIREALFNVDLTF